MNLQDAIDYVQGNDYAFGPCTEEEFNATPGETMILEEDTQFGGEHVEEDDPNVEIDDDDEDFVLTFINVPAGARILVADFAGDERVEAFAFERDGKSYFYTMYSH